MPKPPKPKEVPEAPKEEKDALKQEENALLEEEAMLNREEEAINAKKLEIANRRYALVKRKGEFERKKFRTFLEKYKGEKTQQQSPSIETYPDMQAQISKTKEELASMIANVQGLLQQRRVEEAKTALIETKKSFNNTPLSLEDRKRIEYNILGLETDLKIAALS